MIAGFVMLKDVAAFMLELQYEPYKEYKRAYEDDAMLQGFQNVLWFVATPIPHPAVIAFFTLSFLQFLTQELPLVEVLSGIIWENCFEGQLLKDSETAYQHCPLPDNMKPVWVDTKFEYNKEFKLEDWDTD